MKRRQRLRLDSNAVVHGSSNSLFAAEVAFGCLHGNVAQKELNPVQFSSRCMAKLSARTPEIMRRQVGEADFLGVLFHDMPNHPLGYTVAPVFACAADASEQSPSRNSGCSDPQIIVVLTHSGTGTVRMWQPFPSRSTMAQCS